jgi:wyosine [tRNA(Phe)-imidazoG37] synthetase (radical SAM superfamily)
MPDVPVAVLTNGTLVDRPDVRADLVKADVLLPSLDSATPKGFKAVNHPHPDLDIRNSIEGLVTLRQAFSGQIWLEVFIAPGVNDTPEELDALKAALQRIRADRVQLNTLDRPGTDESLEAADADTLNGVVTHLQLDTVEIVADVDRRDQVTVYRDDIESSILTTIARRPCTVDDLSTLLGLHRNEVNKYLDVLQADGKITPVRQQRGLFYKSK